MQKQPGKAPRKHLTTACVPCRESKIRCDGATPHCQNCERKGKDCRYQVGDDKRKLSLRATTELFSSRVDQLCQFICDHGLEPPPMKPDDESGMNRVLDTLKIQRGTTKRRGSAVDNITSTQEAEPQTTVAQTPAATIEGQLGPMSEAPVAQSPFPNVFPNMSLLPQAGSIPGTSPPKLGPSDYNPTTNWGFTLPTAESLDNIYANINGSGPPADTGPSPDSLQLSQDIAQQPGVLLGQARNDEHDSDSDEEDEAEHDVIEQISNRIGTLKIAGDGHLRFYGATSNLNLVDVSATQQRQRPDARSVRYDGQEILNHLRIGQPVDQALEDHLVELYFTWQNPSTYVVDKEMFMTARAKWRDEFDDTPFYSEVLTNAMCAIGSAFEARYHPTFITFPKSLADFFADRAKALLEIELDTPCVATVQALVILSCHEGSSNRDARGWLYSGMSMRLAFDLGLHLDMTSYVQQGDLSAFEADVRRVTFWGCYSADHFWGFYLGRPFRMNAGDITVPKPASSLGAGRESNWHPYGLPAKSDSLRRGLRNQNELISRQFAVLWEIVSPAGHILYGCTDISRHDLQRLCYSVTEDLFAWKESLPSNLQIDVDDDTAPSLPHLMMLHMQYHQIVIFTHRPWVSKNYIQPRSPRQGPGYHHARRMCIESATTVARILHLYEKHYTFRRMNNQVVSIIFSAALILLYVTISSSPHPAKVGETGNNAEMVAYLNLCFRALDELGQSFENGKRTRDFLVSLQRRWQARMRRSGPAMKRQVSNLQPSQQPGLRPDPRKKTRIDQANQLSSSSSLAPATDPQRQLDPQEPPPDQPQNFDAQQQGDLDWMRNSDFQLLSGSLGDRGFSEVIDPNALADGGGIPNVSDIESWWDSPDGAMFGGSSI